MAIDRNSPAFLFGQIMSRLDEGDRIMQGLTDEVKEVGKALGSLPCAVHDRRIGELDEWRQDCENHSIRQAGIRIKFWHGVILIIVTVSINALVSLLLGNVL